MIIISHRGNIAGPDRDSENTVEQINKAINLSFQVEVDVWYVDKKLYLGHDTPDTLVKLSFLQNKNIWCHAKNIEALFYLLENKVHVFWHQNDDFTLTSNNFLWTFPGNTLTKKSICVLPEKTKYIESELRNCAGVCTDFPLRYLHDLQLRT